MTGKSAAQAFNTAAQADRRRIARAVAAMWDDIARAAGFEPIERRTAFAISTRLYERSDQSPDTPRGVPLALIGSALTSKSDDEEARVKAASRQVSHLFNHAIPKTGFQILTRYKAEKDSGDGHRYVDHLLQIAAFFSELLAEETAGILSDKGIKAKGEKIAEARARLVAEAVTWLPKCEVELITPEGVTYAYVSALEAKAHCEKNPDYSSRSYTYTPPATDEPPKKPFYKQDLERIEDRIKATIENQLGEIAKRNSYDEARLFSTRLDTSVHKLLASWAKVAGAQTTEGEQKELIHAPDLSGGGPENGAGEPVENQPSCEDAPPDNLSGGHFDNFAEVNDLQKSIFETPENEPVENLPDAEPEPTPPLAGSVNFDSALEAALFYVRDGWAVVPCCQFDPATGRCTGPESHHKDGVCKGKVPLIKGKKPVPGAGYTAASRDRGLIRDWFTRQFPDAGVAIRLDGHILIDCDVKDGAPGLESYQILADTFNLPSMLSAATPSGGRHYFFKLPDDLPADFLGSWTRVLDSAELAGIDIKVGNRGLAHVEPSRGVADHYRWLDPTTEIPELPRECCDYLRGVHEREQQAKLEKAQASRTSDGASAQAFDPDEDQAKYFKDMPAGQRRPRLRQIACRLAAGGADVKQIVSVLNYHNAHFTEPVNDPGYIARVARGAVLNFAPEVAPR